MSLKSLLFGIDRSESSRRAARFAIEQLADAASLITIVHVINWSPYAIQPIQDTAERAVKRKQEIAAAQSELVQPFVAWLESEGLLQAAELTTVVQHGRPSEVLADLAAETGSEVIVVGRIGEANLRTAIFGSTASRLAQHAPVPVVVVP